MRNDKNAKGAAAELVAEGGAVVGFWRKRPEGGAETYYPLWRSL